MKLLELIQNNKGTMFALRSESLDSEIWFDDVGEPRDWEEDVPISLGIDDWHADDWELMGIIERG